MGALAGERLRKKFPVPVFSPCALLCREAAERPVPAPTTQTPGARVVAVLGSETSLASGFYQEALARVGVRGILCPASALAEAVAEGLRQAREGQPAGTLETLVEEALAPALESEARVEAVLLAESALGLVTPLVERVVGPGIPVIEVLAELAGEVERMLSLSGVLRPPGADGSRKAGARHFLASGDVDRFRERGAALFGGPLGRVVKASPQSFFEPRAQ